MLKVSRHMADELLGRYVEQGHALVERAGLVGDASDYESWKAARKQWIERTAEGLGEVYDSSDEADQFQSAASAPASGERWQMDYTRDLECVRAAIDVLISLQDEPDLPEERAQEHHRSDPAEHNPERGAEVEIEQAPAATAERDPEPADVAERDSEPAGSSKLEHEPADVAEIEPEPADVAEIEPEPADVAEPLRQPTAASGPAREVKLDPGPAPEPPASDSKQAPSVGAELAPARSVGSVLAPAPSGGANGGTSPAPSTSAGIERGSSRQVFLVHGRNEQWKEAVFRLLERAGPHGITILNERPNGRSTIVERFEEQDGGSLYAIILLTADDVGAARLESGEEPYFSPRARQGVVFEMGFLVAALTPRRVCVLYEDGVELPCDLAGIPYVRLDLAGTWQSKLLLQLRKAGLEYDLNQLAPVT